MSAEGDTNSSAVGSPSSPSKDSIGQVTNGLNGSENGGITRSPPKSSTGPVKGSNSPDKFSSDDSFVQYGHEDTIADSTFEQLMGKMRTTHYNIKVNKEELIVVKCKLLFEKDYIVEIVKNNNVADNYPADLIIPIAVKDSTEQTVPMNLDAELYSQLSVDARIARLRSRVVVPTILFDNKFVCRSGTLTVWLSALYETLKTQPLPENVSEDPLGTVRSVMWSLAQMAYNSVQLLMGQTSMEELLAMDLKILEHLKVERICDLMVEYNKHYRQQVNVSSTEKAHEEIYKDIKMEEFPFPGCEFFTLYNKAGKKPEGLVFDWSQSDVTRSLELTEDPKQFFPDIEVNDFKKWDLVQLTQNYLKIMLSYLVKDAGGMVVHCISGWDRTPLFVCLLRLSLWADGVIHQNLKPDEMAYLTVAYDWFLFGHNLPNRLQKNEEVMHFCFNFLSNIISDEFSVTRMFKELAPEKRGNRQFPEFVPGRRVNLGHIRATVLDFYNQPV